MPRCVPLLLALLCACVAPPLEPKPPIPEAAARALAEARDHLRGAEVGDMEAHAAARAAALRALEVAPDWIAARRLLDDELRWELRAPEALAQHRRALARAPDAAELYLAGRLQGAAGEAPMRAAERLDPREPWIRNGLAWNALRRDDLAEARRQQRQALALARDPTERAFFAWALARHLVEAVREGEAIEVLVRALADEGLSSGDRSWLSAELANLELASPESSVRRRGVQRALTLLERGDLTWGEIDRLLDSPFLVAGIDALHLALASRDGGGRRAWRGELLLREGPSALARALLEREGEGSGLSFSHGDPTAPIEAWLAQQPAFVLDAEGLPREPGLARLVGAARAIGSWEEAGAAERRALGEALLGAGWFREALAYAGRLPAGDLEWALDLDRRARAGRGVLISLERLLYDLDRGEAQAPPRLEWLPGEDPEPTGVAIDDLDGLLDALAPALARAAPLLGGPTESEAWAAALARSPRLGYGLAGEVLHPGPHHPGGEPVEGLASVMARLGRFALLGDGFGHPPDGTVLRRVWVEERAGEHLGVAWSGTVAWCDGADIPSRAGREGANIAGAALHEGYWVDLVWVRNERARWSALAQRLWEEGGAAGAGRVAAALDCAPVALEPGEARTDANFPLGEADRLRVAVMRDRAGGAGRGLVVPALEEFCAVTAAHEEGHLCDRTRFLPVSEHLGAVVGLLFASCFSPLEVNRRLEARAQLVALAVVDDPRLPLAEIVQAAEEGGTGPTPHWAAYAGLLNDFLSELDRRVTRSPGGWQEIDPGAFLVHQLHRLGPERVRELALALARRRGLVAGG